ncbi:STE24 endopeptidase [Draconibacterium orientale]|uniref:Peptidase M48 n=1 Tax=Draconibacterium orientale TaxID=1168034 RepID=X5DW63_9BACT|nr:M48 family metallopeptidase [Draconibacterium orientale]AHW58511.1 peptidase M48 [Draconibacterium orientale]SET88129.1 STE24 endopeptidase [Draconibacterium orientale]
MHEILFWIIIGILVVDFIFEKYLSYLNTTTMSDTIPEEVKGIYDEEKYKKQQAYQRENHRFGILTSSFSMVITLAMFLLYGFALVDGWAWSFTGNAILAALIFFGIIMFASDIIGTPFEIYDTFKIEEKYGFNKTTPKIFVLDKVKGWLVSAVIGGGLLALVIFIYQLTGNMFWVYAWLVVSAFSIFMAMFYSNLIVPLFNKQTPLEEGELRDAISAFAHKVGFKLDNIFVIDGSKRSTKANAYFTGLGAKKRIVLYDTLINDLETEELVAVLAHEIGHNKKKHVVQGLLIGLVQTAIVLFVFGLLIDSPVLSAALGVEEPNFHIGMVAFGVLYSPISFFTGIFMNMLSRKNEYQADRFAAENYKPEALASALKKLSINNLSNLTPHKTFVFFHYSHPTLLQRLAFLKSFEK